MNDLLKDEDIWGAATAPESPTLSDADIWGGSASTPQQPTAELSDADIWGAGENPTQVADRKIIGGREYRLGKDSGVVFDDKNKIVDDPAIQQAFGIQQELGIGDYASELGRSTVRGVAGAASSTGKGLGVLTSDNAAEIERVEQGIANLGNMSAEEATAFMRGLPSKLSPAVAFNYQVAIRKLWKGDTEGAQSYLDTARKYIDTTPVEEQSLTKAGKELEAATTKAFPQDPRFKGSITSDIGQAAGSSLFFLPIGLLTGGTGVAAAGAAAGAAETYDSAKQDIQNGNFRDDRGGLFNAGLGTAAESAALEAGRLGAIPGASEVVPTEIFLEQMPKFIPGLRTIANTPVWGRFAKAFGRVGTQVLSEGGQEAFQTWASNLINQLKINPSQDVTEDVLYNALLGGVVGGGMQTGVEGYNAVFGKDEPASTNGGPINVSPPQPGQPATPPQGQRIDPTLFPTQPGQQPPGAPPAEPPISDDAWLMGAGYTAEQIDDMNPEERASAAEEAVAQGVEPVDLTAGAPVPGTAPMAPRGTRTSRVNVQSEQDLEAVRPTVNAEPSEAQAAAGNYQKGHIKIHGFDVSIENPRGSVRRGKNPDGELWESPPMPGDYGYIKRSEAKDGDHVDVFIGPNPASTKVYVIDQNDLRTGRFDEPKVVIGADSLEEAVALYEGSFSDGKARDRIRAVTGTTPDEVKNWLASGTIKKPFPKAAGSSTDRWTPQARAEQGARVSPVEGDENTLSQPQLSPVQGLRGQGNNDLSGVDGGLRGVSEGYGGSTQPEAYTGPDGQQRTLQPGEYALGNEGGAEPQQAASGTIRVPRANSDAVPMGGAVQDVVVGPETPGAARLDNGAGNNTAGAVSPASDFDSIFQEEMDAEYGAAPAAAPEPVAVAKPRAPRSVNDVLEFIASIGGISDPTGELAGMDLPKMTRLGPVVRKNGLHPDKVREALVEAGLIYDPGYGTDRQAESTPNDVFDLISRHMGGDRVYMPDRQAQAEERAITRAAGMQNPELEGKHPIASRWGDGVWAVIEDFLAENGSYEEAWSPGEINDVARMVNQGMNVDDAFERAAAMHENDLLDFPDIAPEITAAFERTRQTDMLDLPPFPDVEPSNVAQQPEAPADSDAVLASGEDGGRPAGEAEAGSPGAQARDTGESSPEAGSSRDNADPQQDVAPSSTEWLITPNENGVFANSDAIELIEERAGNSFYKIRVFEPQPGKFIGTYDYEVAGHSGGGAPAVVRDVERGKYYAPNPDAKVSGRDAARMEQVDWLAEKLEAAFRDKDVGTGTKRDIKKLLLSLKKITDGLGIPFDPTPEGERQPSALDEPTTEKGADKKEQLVIPGAEKDQKGALNNAAKAPLKASAPQKGMDVGLFGSERDQTDMFDKPVPKKAEERKQAPLSSRRQAPLSSRSTESTFATEFMTELAQVDDLFRYLKSGSASLERVLSVVDPNIEPRGRFMLSEADRQNGVVSKKRFVDPDGYDFFVLEDGDGQVWLDISGYKSGLGGSAVYAAVANYAHNARKVFIGDPAGLSDDALLRRTEAMLSSALKFGTTRHIEPHPRQLQGAPEINIPPLKWTYGDDFGNVASLIEASTANTLSAVPEIADVRYDFGARAFRDAQGRAVSDGTFDRWRVAARSAGKARPGNTTLKRVVLLNTLLRTEGGARPGLLAQVLRQPSDMVRRGGLEGLLYSKGNTVATVTGREIMAFTGRQDMPALRQAATRWYDENLRGTTATTKDGRIVRFTRKGMGKTTSSSKGDILLRAIPAIRAIIEKGDVVFSEPGNRPGVLERMVISAPVDFAGTVHQLAVSVHRAPDGNYQYDFTFDREAGGEKPGVTPGGLAQTKLPLPSLEVPQLAAGDINLFELSPGFKKAMTEAPQEFQPGRKNPYRFTISAKQRAQILWEIGQIAERILGHRLASIELIADQQVWNDTFGDNEDAVFDPNTGIIYLALHGTQDVRATLRHEAVHALRQAGVISAQEWAVLSRMAQTRWIDQYKIRDRYEAVYRERFDISEAELEQILIEEAIADAMADSWGKAPSEDVVGRIFARIKTFLEAVRNALRGQGFTTASQILEGMEQGAMARRQPGTGQGRDFLLYARQGEQAPLSSRRRLTPPQNPAPGSFEAPHDERVQQALADSTDSLLNRLKRAGKAAGIETLRKLQDREIDLLRTQNAIEQANGGPLAEPRNAYLAASLYPGRVAQRDRNLVQDIVEPLVEDIARRGLSLDEVNDFVMARHAIERNLEVGKTHEPGSQFHEAMTNPAIVGGSGMSENDANDILNAAQASGKFADLEAVGDEIVAMNRHTLDNLYAEGLITQEQYDALTQKYQYYVPLRGWDDVTNEQHPDDIKPDSPKSGRRYDIRGQEFQRAFGRTTKADSPLAYSIMQARQANIRIEKNRVGKRFLRLAQANPNEAFWQINRVDLKKIIDPNTGYVRNVFDQGAKEADNVYAVKVGGKRYNIILHHDGLLNAMKGMGAENMHPVVVALHRITRFLAAVRTQWAPQFIFTNFFRDVQQAGIVLQEEKEKGITNKIIGSIGHAAYGMNQMLKGDFSSQWARYAREFADAGGKIGFMDRADIALEKRNLDRLMRDARPSLGRKAWLTFTKHTIERIDRYNDSIENTLRLSTYVHLRQAGATKDRAAMVARDLTVNFNRKGEWSAVANSLFMFFNASTQGGANFALRLYRSKKLRKIAAGMIVYGFVQSLLNRMLGGDDDDEENRWNKLSMTEKQRNHIIMLPKWLENTTGLPYLKIPAPLSWNLPMIIGMQVEHAVSGAISPLEAAANMVGAIGDSFNPLGGGGTWANLITPTLGDPIVDINQNRDFFGDEIVPRQFDETTPFAQRFNPNVSPQARWLTDTLSSMTGGSPERPGAIDWSPEWVEHIFDFALGGIGQMFSRTSAMVTNLASGDDLDLSKVPFVNVFVGRDSTFADRDEYFQIRDAVHITEKELRARIAEKNPEAAAAVRRDHARELKMMNLLDAAEKQLAKLRKDYKAVKGSLKMGEQARAKRLEAITERMNEIQRKVRTKWNQLGEDVETSTSSGAR